MSKGTDSHYAAFRSKSAASTGFCADDEKLFCLKSVSLSKRCFFTTLDHYRHKKKPLLHHSVLRGRCFHPKLWDVNSWLFRACPCDLFKGQCGFQSSWYLSVLQQFPIDCSAQKKKCWLFQQNEEREHKPKAWADQRSWWESVWFDSFCRAQTCWMRVRLQCEPHTTAGCRELVQVSGQFGQESLLFCQWWWRNHAERSDPCQVPRATARGCHCCCAAVSKYAGDLRSGGSRKQMKTQMNAYNKISLTGHCKPVSE